MCGSTFEVIPFREETAKYCSRECRIDATRQITGSDRYNYKPDSGKEFGEGWNELAEKVRERDDHVCQACAVPEDELNRKLDVHHIRPRSKFDDVEQANTMDNLISLCRSCHKKWEGIPLKPQ
jgi:5-methylcytosine-specific restriction endonuclease McrA